MVDLPGGSSLEDFDGGSGGIVQPSYYVTYTAVSIMRGTGPGP
jgi:hypothetical protein